MDITINNKQEYVIQVFQMYKLKNIEFWFVQLEFQKDATLLLHGVGPCNELSPFQRNCNGHEANVHETSNNGHLTSKDISLLRSLLVSPK